jgi:prepilin-type N-terminal cleavage/methylation domain-containing protein
MINCKFDCREACARRGFTLIELLITVSIMAMMAGMILFALYSAQESAKEAKTKSIIAKLDSIIKAKWDSYKTRRVPITIAAGTAPTLAAKYRLDALRDLMRMEMPDRWQDVIDAPATLNGAAFSIPTRPALSQGYFRRYSADSANLPPNKIASLENAECLYLIVTAVAMEGEIDIDSIPSADTDNNGMPEFLDGWGKPIRWLRWAPGFQSDLQTPVSGTVVSASPSSGQTVILTATGANFSQSAGAYVGGTIAVLDSASSAIVPTKMARITGYTYSSPTATFTCSSSGPVSVNSATGRGTTMQALFGGSSVNGSDSFVVMGPDPFDPTGTYPMYASGSATAPTPDTSIPSFALYPLIYSAGPDKLYATKFTAAGAVLFSYGAVNDNPMTVPNDVDQRLIGTQQDDPGFTSHGWLDNIHNHILNVK